MGVIPFGADHGFGHATLVGSRWCGGAMGGRAGRGKLAEQFHLIHETVQQKFVGGGMSLCPPVICAACTRLRFSFSVLLVAHHHSTFSRRAGLSSCLHCINQSIRKSSLGLVSCARSAAALYRMSDRLGQEVECSSASGSHISYWRCGSHAYLKIESVRTGQGRK